MNYLGVPDRIIALLHIHKFDDKQLLKSVLMDGFIVTHEQVLKWLREEYGLHIILKPYVTLEDEIGWDYSISKIRTSTNNEKPLVDFDPVKVTYYQYYVALEAAIEQCFELILFNEI